MNYLSKTSLTDLRQVGRQHRNVLVCFFNQLFIVVGSLCLVFKLPVGRRLTTLLTLQLLLGMCHGLHRGLVISPECGQLMANKFCILQGQVRITDCVVCRYERKKMLQMQSILFLID